MNKLTQFIDQYGVERVDCNIKHFFGGGVYLRERFAKAGTLIIGKRHRYETMSILLQGELLVLMDKGNTKKHIAPEIWVTPEGSRRVTYSKTDTILATVHSTNETDVDKLEQELTISEEEFKLLNSEVIS